MAIYIINKNPVYLSHSRFEELKDHLTEGWSVWSKASTALSHEGAKALNKLIINFLTEELKKDKNKFYEDWVTFDYSGTDAIENVYDILEDYCFYSGYAGIKDIRSFPQQITDDFLGNSYQYTKGRIFLLTHFIKPNKWWWKYRYKMKGRELEILIDTNKVIRILGTLDKFVFGMNSIFFQCSEGEIKIIPSTEYIDYFN